MEIKKKVFLVEDDEIFTFLVQTRLSQMTGIDLIAFDTGQPMLDRLGEEPDVIFLDYSLPVMDGLEVLRNTKAKAPNARVIMLSGLEWDHIVNECLDAGAEDFIQKDSQVAQKVHQKLVDLFPELA